jgi:Cu-Zn family superoxide dismutase
MKRILMFTMAVLLGAGGAMADEVMVTMHLVSPTGIDKEIGSITAKDTQYGTVFMPKLSGLAPGLHGLHVHQNPDCGPGESEGKMVAGLAAGGHYDPMGAGYHAGPYGEGHLGDLPGLYVDAEGKSTHPMLAPRIKVGDLRNRSLMIHAGGDNYSDQPAKLGGGGARMACGVVR